MHPFNGSNKYYLSEDHSLATLWLLFQVVKLNFCFCVPECVQFDTKMENGRAGMPSILEPGLAGQARLCSLLQLCLQVISTTTGQRANMNIRIAHVLFILKTWSFFLTILNKHSVSICMTKNVNTCYYDHIA